MSAHPCPCGCGADIPQHMLSCRRSWYSLPKTLRNGIWDAFTSGDTGRHAELITEAVDLLKPKGASS